MKTIFEQGSFRQFYAMRLNEAMEPILEHSQFQLSPTTVFISHKHDDLEDLRGVLGFLEKNFNVKVYIDSQDPSMPKITSAKTATNIKNRILKCDKFILLATNGAIESKWCNWELGFGDAHKFKEHIALFPMKPKGSFDYEYKGSEYMAICPYISYYDGTETYTSGRSIARGYYVRWQENGSNYITSLDEWFRDR